MIWLEINMAGLLLGLWRAWDGAGVYLPGAIRGITGGLLVALIVYAGGWWSANSPLSEHASAIALVAGVTYPIIRGFRDWDDLELTVGQFGLPAAVGAVPLLAMIVFGPHPLGVLVPVAFVAVVSVSGIVYSFEGALFGSLPMPKIGLIRFDAHRWAEFFNCYLIGASLSAVTNWAVLFT